MKNIIKFFKAQYHSSTKYAKVGVTALMLTVLGLPLLAQAATLTRELQIGMSGSDVSALQTFLAQDSTIYPQGLVTGYFGPLTKTAVSNFQARNGISTVGRVGPVTLVAINAQMNGGSTVGSHRQSPIINSLSVGTTNTSATFNWYTDENTSAMVYYSPFPLAMTEASASTAVTISGSTFLVHADLRSTHSGVLTGLQPNTRYYYVVYARDSSGNETVTTQLTLQTSN